MAQGKKKKIIKKLAKASTEDKEYVPPTLVEGEEKKSVRDKYSKATSSGPSTSNRKNAAADLIARDEYTNLSNGLVPFRRDSSNGLITAKDAIYLCQQAYFNYGLFKNTIDLMTEFSNSNIYLKGGSKKYQQFFYALFDKINIWNLSSKFFREFYRSGNVFIYRYDVDLSPDDVAKFTQTFGNEAFAAKSKGEKATLPGRYVLLNPTDIGVETSLVYSAFPTYYKIITGPELLAMKNPKTDTDKKIVKKFDTKIQEQIKSSSAALIPIDWDNLNVVFYNRQDYEPFAVPMGFPVLKDINAKMELKKMDIAINRTIEQAVLLVTTGTEIAKGGINYKNISNLTQLFQNQSVARVIIADYTTKAEFIIPDISKVVGQEKYAQINEDIRIGLNNISFGEGEKYSNTSIKVQMFIERLKEGRRAFINEFLLPEIKRVAKDMGFKNYPMPYFEEVDLKDELEFNKVYNQMMSLGILAPWDGIRAMESGELPAKEDLLQSQQEYKDLKDKGYFVPLVGGSAPSSSATPAGRPTGPGKSMPNRKPGKTGASFSLSKIQENINSIGQISDKVESILKKKHKLKNLNDAQKEVAAMIVNSLVLNEDSKEWNNKIKDYVENQKPVSQEAQAKINEIIQQHDVPDHLAIILYHSLV